MPTIETTDCVVHANSGTDVFVPMTGPINEAEVKQVRVAVYFTAKGALEGQPGVQFSDDGVQWGTPYAFNPGAGFYATAAGWNFTTGFSGITSASVASKLFVHFGLFVHTTGGATTLESAVARLSIEVKPTDAATYVSDPVRVHTLGNTATWALYPITGAIEVANMTEARATMEIMALVGNIDVRIIWQTTNTPDNLSSWSPATPGTDFLNSQTNPAVGVYFGGNFNTGVTTTAKYIRFVVAVKNNSGTNVNAAILQCRVDAR